MVTSHRACANRKHAIDWLKSWLAVEASNKSFAPRLPMSGAQAVPGLTIVQEVAGALVPAFAVCKYRFPVCTCSIGDLTDIKIDRATGNPCCRKCKRIAVMKLLKASDFVQHTVDSNDEPFETLPRALDAAASAAQALALYAESLFL